MCSGYRDVLEGKGVCFRVQECAIGYRGVLEGTGVG